MATSTIKSSGGDYTTLTAWEAATQGDFVTAKSGEIAECYIFASGLTDTLSVSGSTTNATYHHTIRCAAGQRHDGTPSSGFWMTAAAGFKTCITAGDDYVEINGIDVEMPNDRRNTGIYCSTTVGSNVTDCIAVLGGIGFRSTSGTTSDTSNFTNCLAVNQTSTGGNGYGFVAANSSNDRMIATYSNCVSIGAGAYGFRDVDSGSGNPELKTYRNCVAVGSGTADWVLTGTEDIDYCADSDATAPGAHSVTGITSTDFLTYASDDYHLSGTGSTLYHAGTPVSGVTTDVDGDTYDATTPSIGFDEIVSAGGDTSTVGTVSAVSALVGTGGATASALGVAAGSASVAGTATYTSTDASTVGVSDGVASVVGVATYTSTSANTIGVALGTASVAGVASSTVSVAGTSAGVGDVIGIASGGSLWTAVSADSTTWSTIASVSSTWTPVTLTTTTWT